MEENGKSICDKPVGKKRRIDPIASTSGAEKGNTYLPAITASPSPTTNSSPALVAQQGAIEISPSPNASNLPDPPPYGSKDYWERRYQSLKDDLGKLHEKTILDCASANNDEVKPDPFHAWYFNFEELAPLILPLILGEQVGDASESEDVIESDQHDDYQGDCDRKKARDDTESCGSNESDQDLDEDDADNDTQSQIIRTGLAQTGPIRVLEVGCGDVPLGRDLISSILELEAHVGVDASNVLREVVCLDYSENVIEAMTRDQKLRRGKSSKADSVTLKYQVADARQLPFEDDTFELLLEKGTLDAMLSDRDGNGAENCRKIVGECSRVVSPGGYIVIISHLNAHCQAGRDWLNDIVVPGLRRGARYEWSVEVHGNEADIPSDVCDDNSNDGDENHLEPTGPAVYIIQKGNLLPQLPVDLSEQDQPMPTIPLRFFSY